MIFFLVHDTSDFPRKIVVTTAANGTLKWEQKNGVFYAGGSTSKKLAVLYLVLKAEVDLSNYNSQNEAQFDWTISAVTEVENPGFLPEGAERQNALLCFSPKRRVSMY